MIGGQLLHRSGSVVMRIGLPTLCAITIFLGAWLLRPYTYMTNNHALQLPLVQQHQDPHLYTNDPYVETLRTYSSLYWIAIARVTFLPTKTTLGIVYLLTLAGGLTAAWLLGRALAPDSALAPWASVSVFALGITPFVGGGTISRAYPEQTGLAVVFFILAFAGIAARRPWLAAVAYAVGLLLNQMYGVHVGLYILVFAAVTLAKQRLAREWLWAALFAGVWIAPVLLMSRRTALALDLSDPQFARAWSGALHHAGGGHFYPLANSPIGFISLTLVLMAVLVFTRTDSDGWRKSLAQSTAITAAMWIAIAFIVAHVLKPSAALMLQGMRGADLFHVFGLIYLTTGLVAAYERRRFTADERLLPLTGIVGLLMLYRLLSITLAVVGLMALSLIGGVRDWLHNAQAMRVACAMAAMVLVVSVWSTGTQGFDQDLLFRMGASQDIQAAASWAEANTDITATFMVNPSPNAEEHAMFRPLSRRSVFVAYKDIAAIHWRADYLPVFMKRMDALGAVASQAEGRLHPAEEIDSRWHALSDEDLSAVAQNFGVDFAVFPTTRETELVIVYQNDTYTVARFPSAFGQ